ncbi:hypothetical protein AMAG_20612 [Allomyces macrogynus ATCC 38327]|uniref:Uncharacterized protein n=1 Tax=Allomyces macrogynus (strain ATCC 38327) TaxID=578462 RepID=A0A0L0TD29_ALLM3|nr:hypothetical protein AMAG_20612 [Allomyces macrogynus ATCC 38327]|eukprot:KNE72580.1 hypothetical protein AMAG_20612 [Allomyces macrogynus ATCC 38327]
MSLTPLRHRHARDGSRSRGRSRSPTSERDQNCSLSRSRPRASVPQKSLVDFRAIPHGGTVQQVTAHPTWRNKFISLFRNSSFPRGVHVGTDELFFTMLRSPSIVEDVMRESGAVIGNVLLEFEPVSPADRTDASMRVPQRAVFLLIDAPSRVRELWDAINYRSFRSDVLDLISKLSVRSQTRRYAFFTVADGDAGRVMELDYTRIQSSYLRVFHIRDVKAAFANQDKVMDMVRSLVAIVDRRR